MTIEDWLEAARRAERSCHAVLSTHELAKSRVIVLEGLTKRLSGAPVDVQDYFRESIQCLELALNRPAIVFSWAGFFSIFSERLFADHEAAIRSKRPKWRFNDAAELREEAPEAQILDVAKEVGMIKRASLRIYQGQLSTRNQCAHPTLYRPSNNESIGFVDTMLEQAVAQIAG